MEQALLQLEHLPREEAWQVPLAPFGLRVVTGKTQTTPTAAPGVEAPATSTPPLSSGT